MADNTISVKVEATVTELTEGMARASASVNDHAKSLRDLIKVQKETGDNSDEMNAKIKAEASALAEARAAREQYRAALAASSAATREASEAAEEQIGILSALHEKITLLGEGAEGMTAKLSVFSDAFSKIGELALVGFGGERLFEGFDKVAETGEQMSRLAQITGLTTQELSALRVIAVEAGGSFDEFQAVLPRLANSMQEAAIKPASKAGEAFKAMGIQVTDAAGNLRPMGSALEELSKKLSDYQDGTAKTALEMDVLGSKIGASLLPALQLLGEEGFGGAIAKSEALRVSWSGADAEAAETFKRGVNDLSLGFDGLKQQIVLGALPALNQLFGGESKATGTTSDLTNALRLLGAVLASVVVAAADIVRIFEVVYDEFAILDQQVEGVADTIGEYLAKLTIGVTDAAAGNLSGAAEAFETAGSAAAAKWKQHMTQVEADSKAAADHIKAIFAPIFGGDGAPGGDNPPAGGQGGGTPAPTIQPPPKKGKKDKYKWNDDGLDDSLDESIAQNQKVQASQAQTDSQGLDADVSTAKIGFETKKALLDQEVDAHKITQEQKIEALQQFADQEYQIELQALQEKEVLFAQEPEKFAQTRKQIETLEAAHQAEMAKLSGQMVKAQATDQQKLVDDWKKALSPIDNAFSSSIKGMIQGTQTLQQGMAHAAQSILLSFIDTAEKGLTNWLATELAKTAATDAGVAARTVASNAGSADTLATQAATAQKSIFNDANKAYADVFAWASPTMGPYAAIPAAAAWVAVEGMGSGLFSAEGGMDIGNANPLIQAHAYEMVLPRPYANVIREMAANGGSGGAGGIGGAGGAGGAAGDTHHHHYQVNYSPNISGKLSRGEMEATLRQHGSILARYVDNEMRNRKR